MRKDKLMVRWYEGEPQWALLSDLDDEEKKHYKEVMDVEVLTEAFSDDGEALVLLDTPKGLMLLDYAKDGYVDLYRLQLVRHL